MTTRQPTADQLKLEWTNNPRWKGVERPYDAGEVVRLRGAVPVEYSLARRGAERLWRSLHDEPYVNALGALTGSSDHGVSKSLYGRDPDGNEFEIMWQVPCEAWGDHADRATIMPLDLDAELRRWGAGVTA